MESILSFSLKSALGAAVFVGYYMLALKNARMHRFNRAYLLIAAALSLLLPFTGFEMLRVSPVALPDFPLLKISATGTAEAFTNAASPNSISWPAVFTAGYFAVTLLMLLGLAAKSTGIYFLKSKGQSETKDGFVLVKTDDPRAPFSFMNLLFWPTHLRQYGPEGQSILMHELAHIRQRHTLDKLFIQLILAACWLNPFNWLIRKELWLQHEFLADEYAIGDRDGESFARMLLQSAINTHGPSIINPFFQSPVKRRFLMLTRPARNSYSLLRRFLSIPVLLSAAVLLSAHKTPHAGAAHSAKKIVLVLDAAHGGNDAGGKSVYGYVEKDFTLALCQKLVVLSTEYNIQAITTRTEDVYPSLQERVQKSNSNNADVFLSVHINQSSAVRDNTYQLGINPKSRYRDETMLLASAVAGRLKTQHLPVEIVDHSMAYILRENKRPALLIECGNLDDADNVALLKDEARTETLCRNILRGIVDYKAKLNAK